MQTIDLISFLQNYYGIFHERLSFETLTHEAIMKLFPFIKTCSKGYIKLDDLQSGNIIGVYDKYKRVMFYYNPHLNLGKMEVNVNDKYRVDNDSKEISLDNLDKLSKDELLAIRRKLRLAGRRKESYMINDLIRKIKRDEPVEYREKKRKLLIKERMNYD